ncbi:MAG: hypothetical protein D6824_08115, partial [Planctomycetota bacterium]
MLALAGRRRCAGARRLGGRVMSETRQDNRSWDGSWEAMDRRQALRLCAGAAAVVAAGPAALSRALAQQQESPFTWSKLSARAQVAMGGGGNALVYT